jgi:death-on-curing protein
VPAWRYLTAAELIDHGKQFKLGPVRDREALEACMVSPAQTFGGSDLYPEIADKAAIVTFNVAKTYHPFVDGNKRAAAISMLATCYLNGFVPAITQAELVAVIMLTVQDEMDRGELAAFLRDRMT